MRPGPDGLVDFGVGPYVHGTPSRRFPVYTRGNAGEVYPQPVFPLTAAMVRALAGDPARDFLRSTGMVTRSECDEEADVFMGVFAGYTYLNLSVTRVVAVRTPRTSAADADAPFLGAEGLAPPHVRSWRDVNPLATVRGLAHGWRVLAATDLPELDAAADEIDRWRSDLVPVAESSDDELVTATVGMLPMVGRIFALHLAITGGTGIGLDVLRKATRRRGRAVDLMALLGGLGGVASADPSVDLWALGRMVRADAGLTELFNGGVDGLDTRLRTGGPSDEAVVGFVAALDAVVARHGARGPNEWEMGCDVWGTDPNLVLALVDRMRHADDDHDPAVRGAVVADREAAVAAARQRVRPGGRWLFDRGLSCVVLRTRGRERCKTILVEAIHEGRLRLRELGRRLAERHPGVAHDDLFYVTLDELDAFRSDPAAFADVVASRRETRDRLAGLEPPFCFSGEIPPVAEWPAASGSEPFQPTGFLPEGTVLNGTPGASGVARGRARIVVDPGEPGDLGPGDVLVAPLTDPAWTPLFVPVEAVVVDVGGQMSHAVIVSRELGLPCVVAVTGATTAIAEGTQIEVDGSAGTVRILPE
ncbi:MAG: PEP-utilizing enzyme [Actinomycetota bacterium]|jgi:pyruvate,water dikinase|nr:PEP-utilizing enzyme [Actinomycetota bacterium]MEE2957857.1 PEP-utilizing enzyme [Actinomycetota bacterium]